MTEGKVEEYKEILKKKDFHSICFLRLGVMTGVTVWGSRLTEILDFFPRFSFLWEACRIELMTQGWVYNSEMVCVHVLAPSCRLFHFHF